jgi:hypothetical protein
MPRSIRKTSFIAAQNVGFDLVESGNDMPYTGGQHDALVGNKALRPAHRTVLAHEYNDFGMGVYSEAPCPQCIISPLTYNNSTV